MKNAISGPGYLYISAARSVYPNWVKIGLTTTAVRKRISQGKTYLMGYKAEHVFFSKKIEELEEALHGLGNFTNNRIFGEWYDDSVVPIILPILNATCSPVAKEKFSPRSSKPAKKVWIGFLDTNKIVEYSSYNKAEKDTGILNQKISDICNKKIGNNFISEKRCYIWDKEYTNFDHEKKGFGMGFSSKLPIYEVYK